MTNYQLMNRTFRTEHSADGVRIVKTNCHYSSMIETFEELTKNGFYERIVHQQFKFSLNNSRNRILRNRDVVGTF